VPFLLREALQLATRKAIGIPFNEHGSFPLFGAHLSYSSSLIGNPEPYYRQTGAE
jgi:hypothetical protein